MDTERTSPIRFAQALGRIFCAAGPLAAAGAYPTWRYAGLPGLLAELVAVAIVVAVASAGMIHVVRQGRRGSARMAVAFVFLGMVKAMSAAALAAIAWSLLHLSPGVLALWVCLSYAAVMIALCAWMLKVLRRGV